MTLPESNLLTIKSTLLQLAKEYGFQDLRVSDTSTQPYFKAFQNWVANQLHGDMTFLERNHELRENPGLLHPNTCRVLSLRYDYLPEKASFTRPLKNTQIANVSRYALGRDYHKIIRKKLAKLCEAMNDHFKVTCELDTRVFVDSAPVLETAFAEKSGIGWKGKHSLIINKDAGSWFFLGEIFINQPLPVDPPVADQCGQCTACIKLCPTDAIIENKTIDARKCISYLTIENKGAIPIELRSLLGNRIYGCDDCQLACPWNRYASVSKDKDFLPRNNLDNASLLSLLEWDETKFNQRLQGSPIRRIGYQNWLRNLSVAIGNGPFSELAVEKLKSKKTDANQMVCEHIDWAIQSLHEKQNDKPYLKTSPQNAKTQKLINCVETMLPRDA